MIEDEKQTMYTAWCETRPPSIRDVALRFKPWRMYRFKDTGRPCSIHSFDQHEDGRVTMKVIAPQPMGLDHLVFGVDPENLELTSEVEDGD